MRSLGRYEILGKLGTGSMGTVYRARDTLLDREIALKTILTGAEVEPELRERFYREARAGARLQHPSIVVVYDLGEVERVAYIAMELLNGADLRKLIDQHTAVPLPAKIEAMCQVCEALAHAHRHGIIHRDIKPSNLFLTVDKRAKVLDFGIARLPSSQLTVEGRVLGTPNYMAPEQIRMQSCDGRADLFSAAVVFFEFLAYVHPFQGDVIPRCIVENEPDSVFRYDSTLPLVLDRIFARALSKDPARRYSTGDEFAGDLRSVLDVLLRNASPTLSEFRLPSEREALPMVTGDETDGAADAANILDLSELMLLVEDFDNAVAVADAPLARRVLQKIETVGAADLRVADALKLYRERLAEVEKQQDGQVGAPQAAGRDPSSGTGSSTKACPFCTASNRSVAVYCIRCGARISSEPTPRQATSGATGTAAASAPSVNATMIAPGTASTPERSQTPVADVPDSPSAKVPMPTAVPPAPGIPWKARLLTHTRWLRNLWPATALGRLHMPAKISWRTPRVRRYLIPGGCGAALMVAILLVMVTKPVPVLPFVATARVASAGAYLYHNSRAGGKASSISRHTLVHVLRLPVSREHSLVPVQPMAGGKAARDGFMRVSDLAQWDSSDADTKLTLILMSFPAMPGSAQEHQTAVAALQQFIDRFPGTSAGHRAHLEKARFETAIARDFGEQDQAAAQQEIASASSDLDAAAGEAAEAVEEIRQQIAALQASLSAPKEPEAPPPPTPKKRQKPDVNPLLDQGESLFRERNIQAAKEIVDKVLNLQSDNPRALKLRDDIQKRLDNCKKYPEMCH